MRCLNTTRFISSGNNLYFIEEADGIFGMIVPETGIVKFYENTPREILGKNSFGSVMIQEQNEIYIVCNEGRTLVLFDCIKEIFTIISNNDDLTDLNCSWAGSFKYQESIYLFSRENGDYIQYDIKQKTIHKKKSGIKDKLCWCCNAENKVYCINWEVNSLYILDIETQITEKYAVGVGEKVNLSSKSTIPLQSVVYDDGCIYLVDSRYILRMELETRNISIIYDRIENDNGARICIKGDSVVVPPYRGNEIVIFNKRDLSVRKRIEISDERIMYTKNTDFSKTGIPCCIGDDIVFPLISTNGYLKINSQNYKMDFFGFDFDENSLIETIKKIMEAGNVIIENGKFGLEDFMKVL